jgi:hypothetical protein
MAFFDIAGSNEAELEGAEIAPSYHISRLCGDFADARA